MNRPAPENWSTRIGVILAVTGSAVGLGNFLRFPGLAAKYDGGAFMIPYFVALLLLGLPLAWAEWSMGRYGGTRGHHSAPGIFRLIWKNKAAPYLGVLGLIVPVVIYMYYVFIESWCLGYAWHYLTGAMDLGRDPEAYKSFFAGYTGIEADASIFAGFLGTPLVFLLICIALNFILINRGLTRGIDLFCLWALPALVVGAL
ncbi:MAG: sodium:calcium symporter, partial [Chthoniobacterales bacterium]